MNAPDNMRPAERLAPPRRRGVHLELAVLGAVTARVGGKVLRFPSRKSRALLAYLALGDAGGESRKRIAGLLWSDSDDAKARGLLRRAASEVKQVLAAAGFDGFRSLKETILLDHSRVRTDVRSVVAAAGDGLVHARLLDTARLADTLGGDVETVDPAFQSWIRTKRQALRDRLTLALETALPADDPNGRGDDIAAALLRLEPTNEVACRHLIHTRIARGEVGGALHAYKALFDELAQEFDAEPSRDTQALVVQIKRQAGWSARPQSAAMPGPAHGTVALPPPVVMRRGQRLFIAVRPFDVQRLDERLRPVMHGFRLELIANLARFREWSVRTLPAWTSRHGPEDSVLPEYVLAATATADGSRFHMIVTLADGAANSVWRQVFTLAPSELITSQSQMVSRIASALKVNLPADRLRRLSGDLELHHGLHDSWLRGQALIHGANPADWLAAQPILKRLAEEAPGFSPGLSSLVQLHNSRHIIFPGVFRDTADHARMVQLAQRAVQIDPVDSRAQLGLAWSHQLLGRTAQASLHADLALELNPNDPWTLISSAHLLAYCGRYRHAIELSELSLTLSGAPSPAQRSYAAAMHFLAGDYQRSALLALGGLEHAPAFAIWRAAAHAHLGDVEEARRILAAAVSTVRAGWHGDLPVSDGAIFKWFLHLFPIAIRDDWERLRRGLALAGGAVDAERHGVW